MIYGSSYIYDDPQKPNSNFNHQTFTAQSKVSNSFLKLKNTPHRHPNYESYLNFLDERSVLPAIEHTHQSSNQTYWSFPGNASRMIYGTHDSGVHSVMRQNFLDYSEFFMEKLFGSSTSTRFTSNIPSIASYLDNILTRTKIGLTTLAIALYYLSVFAKKQHVIVPHKYNCHRYLLSSIMVASKFLNDDTFENKAWCLVGQVFLLEEVNEMEKDFLCNLNYETHITPLQWYEFCFVLEIQIKSYIAKYPPIASGNNPIAWKGPLLYEFKVWDEFEETASMLSIDITSVSPPSPVSSSNSTIQQLYTPSYYVEPSPNQVFQQYTNQQHQNYQQQPITPLYTFQNPTTNYPYFTPYHPQQLSNHSGHLQMFPQPYTQQPQETANLNYSTNGNTHQIYYQQHLHHQQQQQQYDFHEYNAYKRGNQAWCELNGQMEFY